MTEDYKRSEVGSIFGFHIELMRLKNIFRGDIEPYYFVTV